MSEPLSAAELEEAREFGAYERDTFLRLLATVEAKDAAIARLRLALESLVAECDKSIRWRNTRGMRPATDQSAFASTSYSGVLETRRALRDALAQHSDANDVSNSDVQLLRLSVESLMGSQREKQP